MRVSDNFRSRANSDLTMSIRVIIFALGVIVCIGLIVAYVTLAIADRGTEAGQLFIILSAATTALMSVLALGSAAADKGRAEGVEQERNRNEKNGNSGDGEPGLGSPKRRGE